MFLFGMSMSPSIKAALGVVTVVTGVMLHVVAIDVAGGVFVLMAAGQLLLQRRSAR